MTTLRVGLGPVSLPEENGAKENGAIADLCGGRSAMAVPTATPLALLPPE